jgi:hypothetical protein
MSDDRVKKLKKFRDFEFGTATAKRLWIEKNEFHY